MKILVTGSNGQLGSEIKKISEKSLHQFLFTDVRELDITNEKEVFSFLRREIPDAVINCAAYTAVDKAEQEKELAYDINAKAPAILAKSAQEIDASLFHVSTDYVYGGENFRPYTEEIIATPKSVYGETKYQGEVEVLKYEKAFVVRTSWLYSSFGNNFVKTMLRLGKEREEIKVVFDQVGTPTYAADLVDVLVGLVERKNDNLHGIYNFSNEGVCSWYDFAKEIMELSDLHCKLIPIESKDFPTPAKRPFYSVLNKSKVKETLSFEIPHWKDSLKKCLILIKESYGS